MRKKTDARKHFKKVQIQTRFELNRKLKAAPIAPLTKGNDFSCRKNATKLRLGELPYGKRH